MSLESEIARLANVLEKGLTDLTAAIVRQSEITSQVVASPSPPVTTAEPPVKRGRPAAAAPVAEPAAPLVASRGILREAEPNGQIKGPSFDEVVAIAQELARVLTPPVAIKLINQHGAQKLIEMDPAQYPAFYAAAQVALADKDVPF